MIFPFIIKFIPISSIYLPFSRIQSVNFASLFSDFSCFSPGVFHTLNAIHAYCEKYPFYAFLWSHMVYRSQWKRPSGSPTYRSAPGLLPGGTQLPFWYRCAARRAANGGLKNGQAQKQGLKELFFFFFLEKIGA